VRAIFGEGDCYIGMVKDNKFNGYGEKHLANGTVQRGQWRDNQLVG